MTSIFAGVGEAKAARGSNFLEPCRGIFLIDQVKADKSRKNINFVAIEMTTLKILQRGQKLDDSPAPEHRPGEEVSYLIMSDKDMFLPNVKAAVADIAGCSPTEVNEDFCNAMVDDKLQPLARLIVEVYSVAIETRTGGEYTQVQFKGQVSRARCVAEGIEIPTDARFLDEEAAASS